MAPTLTGDWNYPTAVRMGAGRSDELAQVCALLGIAKPLLITDPGLAEMPMLERLLLQCADLGLPITVFSAIKGNPTGANVERGVACCRAGSFDGIIAFGGGSALDAGKAIALAAGQSGSLWDYVDDAEEAWQRADSASILPVVALPTTAGTGSEVGRAAVITDEDQQRKRIVFHPGLMPSVVILDPQLTVGLPPGLTAATGMDALSHNLEAWCAPTYHPMAEGIALQGMRLIHQYLPLAVANGNDLDARGQMLVASAMGATAFQRGLGAMHALAHSLGALYDAHHGLLNAIVMPYVLQANASAIDDRLCMAATALGIGAGHGQGTSADFMSWVLDLRKALNIPHTLADIGIGLDQAQRIGEMAAVDATAATNPIRFTPEQYTEVLSSAVNGRL